MHRFEEGVLVIMFLSTDLKKTQLVEIFSSTIFTAVSLKFYWKNVDIGSPSKKVYFRVRCFVQTGVKKAYTSMCLNYYY